MLDLTKQVSQAITEQRDFYYKSLKYDSTTDKSLLRLLYKPSRKLCLLLLFEFDIQFVRRSFLWTHTPLCVRLLRWLGFHHRRHQATQRFQVFSRSYIQFMLLASLVSIWSTCFVSNKTVSFFDRTTNMETFPFVLPSVNVNFLN